MKAVRIHGFGGIEQLLYEDVPAPVVGCGEVLVRVRATALNRLDLLTREGWEGFRITPPRILGGDVSGLVESVGDGVSEAKTGQRVILAPFISCGRCQSCLSREDNLCASRKVIGYDVDGGYAEYTKVPQTSVFPMPENLSFQEAAAIPVVFTTAWHMLVTKAQIKPGEDVLVHAAGSGVGSAAIQIAKLMGARVITTASTDEKLEQAKALGADEVINYKTSDFVREVRRITGRRGVDVAVEHMGGDLASQTVRALAQRGRLVNCGIAAGTTPSIDFRYLFVRELKILGSFLGTKAEFQKLLGLFSEGKLKPVIYRVLPLKDAPQAHQVMMDRSNFGKVVLVP